MKCIVGFTHTHISRMLSGSMTNRNICSSENSYFSAAGRKHSPTKELLDVHVIVFWDKVTATLFFYSFTDIVWRHFSRWCYNYISPSQSRRRTTLIESLQWESVMLGTCPYFVPKGFNQVSLWGFSAGLLFPVNSLSLPAEFVWWCCCKGLIWRIGLEQA